jgi:Transposase DDE domain
VEHSSKIAGKIKRQITRFAHKISGGYKKPLRKWMVQMLYGIQASKDVKLSNIARSLNEEILLIKTETRLSRNLGRMDLTESINGKLIAEGGKRIQQETVISLDLSDLDKPYAEKMEYLALVRDGSTGETKSKGYWLLDVLGAEVEGEDLIPLYGELYSQEANNFRSENRQILNAMDRVMEGIGSKGIWAIDRGGDRSRLFKGFLERKLRFVIRLVGDRDLILKDGQKKNSLKIAWGCHCPHQRELKIEKDGETKKKTISVGQMRVKLPFSGQPLFLVVVKGFGEKPMMLLTNVAVKSHGVMRILEIYLTRWKCEESYRFIKQAYNLEDVRVLSYTALRNMMVLVQAVFYFVSAELGKNLKLNILLKKLFEKAKRFFEIPEFRQYAIADGIYKILFSSQTGIFPQWIKQQRTGQLLFPFAVEFS